MTQTHTMIEVRDGYEKTRLLEQYALQGALQPAVRVLAVALVKSAPRDDHKARLERLHRFVRDSVPYHREPVEMFHPASVVLEQGGDCDDHALLLSALAWALRYPFIVEPVGDPADPDHYTTRLGWPPHDSPRGDARTTWRSFETTVDALPGEHARDAARRLNL